MRALRYAAGSVLLFLAQNALAGDFSFTGTFNFDTDVQFFTFNLATDTPDVLLRTWSYAGGTNASGSVIPAGGFQPVIDIFDSSGNLLNPGTSIPCGGATAMDPTTGECGDAYYPTTLSFPGGQWAAGTYTVALTEDANAAVGPTLSDGFFGQAVLGVTPPGNWTCQSGSPGFQGNPPTVPVGNPFCDEFDPGVQRTGDWALDILNVTSASEAPVSPEPAGVLLMAFGLAGIGWLRYRCVPQDRSLRASDKHTGGEHEDAA
ncbi:MAG TPA: DVUA0089 family protein [Bryobacteraceae bacterium]|nr:DVUA0089 family protein [Bryobacteraceae bacterium]